MIVQITSDLKEQLLAENLDSAQLILDFTEWKSGAEDDHYFFGRDGLGRGSKFLAHVHMVPLFVPADADNWDKCWQHRWPRKSDRYLFYVDGGRSFGFLLITIINDPGAHKVWGPAYKKYRSDLEHIADEFFHFGKIP